MKDRIEFVSPDSDEVETILVVTGCRTACVDITPFSDRPVRFISSEEDAQQWSEEIMQTKHQGD
ncbi:MAG: hypothetical protein ACP5G0_06295 [Desulfomonilia bacterium]